MDSVTVSLTKPIQAHGDEVTSLTFREPTGEDITVCGYPFRIGDGEATPIAGVITKLIVRLGGIPPNAAKQLNAVDYQSCLAAVSGFFGDAGQTS